MTNYYTPIKLNARFKEMFTIADSLGIDRQEFLSAILHDAMERYYYDNYYRNSVLRYFGIE